MPAIPSRSILRGELREIGLAPLLTLLEMERKDGLLVLQRGRQLGRLFVRGGRLVRAVIEGGRRVSGIEAVCQLFAWDMGRFELWHARIDEEDEMGVSTTFLLMEAARRHDEAGASTQHTCSIEASAAF